ncbi:DNA-binding protein [Methylobacterium sp. J-078]|uniref:DNA-binding protein n=1 Tax=Methylobacterium sp. J-078 TaxID=2836657 RepID=UPI001FBA0FAA|nr:DNA-binding protein [Methylobacterium sp. J-078]MCJ2043665.1 DNA-binding protein [Methylobacterium sp. J-078]
MTSGPARPAAGATVECREAPARRDTLAGLGPRGELALASGARAVLAGIHWPDEAGADAAAQAWLLAYRGRSLTLVARGETDRWGRDHVDASLEGEARAAPAPSERTRMDLAPVDLAGGLVEAGLVPVDAGERETLCRPALLALEAGARRAGRGLWSQAGPGVRDGAALRARMGRFVVAQGAVLRVGERARRTYLDFARKGEDGLTVTVSKRTWRRLQERGLSAESLRGREVRVRGRLEAWRGPTLDVASADVIEILDGERAPRR